MEKRAIIFGAGGFIGGHMVDRLKSEGYWVCGVDMKNPEFKQTTADRFLLGDLRSQSFVKSVFKDIKSVDEIYQFAADMGGAGFVFTGNHDAEIMHNSATINLNILHELANLKRGGGSRVPKIFYSSSACMYPQENQIDPENPNCVESSAYPANPDSEYGWEKLFSERLYIAFQKNYGLEIAIARYHNIYGPNGSWKGGWEKSPAALCRKVASLKLEDDEIEIWGDGNQTRSFLYIDDCIEATRRLMKSQFTDPINIGSEEMVTINQMVDIIAKISKKNFSRKYNLNAPVGVRGRNSSNDLIKKILGWNYSISLQTGLENLYTWINQQIKLDLENEY